MNVLEKILEEIEKAENEYCHEEHSPMFCMGACSMAADVKGIIRSHMDEVPGVQIEEIKKINQEMEEYLFEKYNVEGYDEKLDEIFTRYLSICKNVNFSNWIPVSERLPETSKMVLVTVHTSEWISDYHSKWVPEEEKIHYEEKYRTSYGYIDDRGIWICLDETNNEIYCEKEFGTDKGKAYDVVVAWKPLPESYREKN